MIAAVIPTRFHPPQLARLLAQCRSEETVPVVLESADFGHRIYAMWNEGVERARLAGADTVAVLSDDVELMDGSLPHLARILAEAANVGVVYPDINAPFGTFRTTPLLEPTEGTWAVGGMTGFAFMFRTDLGIGFDEGYGWWYGDDAFEEAVRDAGLLVCRAVGLPVRHTPDGSASRVWDELAPLVAQDRERWERRKVAAA